MADLSWELVGLLRAVLREGSLSGAARALGIAQPTARRQLAAVERQLGTVLFTRSPSGLVPTDAARALLPYTDTIANAVAALVRAASAQPDAAAGTVRITASAVMAAEVLPALFAPLAAKHPDLVLELAASDRVEDVVRRDADVAVRMARPTQTALVATRVGPIPVGLFASKGYLARRGAPTSLADLGAGHALIGDDRGRIVAEALAAAGARVPRASFTFRSDDGTVQLAALRAGLGIGPCQLPLARRSDDLARVLPNLTFPLDTWVVTHEDLRRVARVRLVVAHLVGALRAYVGGRSSRARNRPRAPATIAR